MSIYHNILGVSQDASIDDIKKAYRQLAKKYHPDVNKEPEAENKFKEISDAYEKLTNPEKTFEGMGFNPFSPFDFGFGNQGIDIHKNISLTLEEVFSGCKKQIQVTRNKKCNSCQGSGATSFKSCDFCKGNGQITARQGGFVFTSRCGNCMGKGKIPDETCKECGGSGRSGSETEEFTVEFPAGIQHGSAQVIPGKGMDGGHLIVGINILSHDKFQLFGKDLLLQMPVYYSQLILGDELEVETIDKKKISFKLPKKTSPNKRFVLKNLGMTINSSRRGNLIIELDLIIPSINTNKYLETIHKLKELETRNGSEQVD